MALKVSLEQWQAFVSVVEQGGYAQAAEHLFKSQSTITYGVQKLELALDLKVLEVKGRKAKLTPAGKVIYQRARQLLTEAKQVESIAAHFSADWEPEIAVAVETLFPPHHMLDALAAFQKVAPHTRVTLKETVLSGSDEALTKKHVQVSITGRVPPGYVGEHLLRVPFVPVAAPSHPLHTHDRSVDKNPLALQDLRHHCQLVVSDSGSEQLDSGWLEATQRLTFSNQNMAIAAAVKGLGYSWFPEQKIATLLTSGELKPLPMKREFARYVDLYLVLAEGDASSNMVNKLASCIRNVVKPDS
ncbi:MAG: LysR family transcriptional regulator [Pontibacterium sp.]